MTISGERTEQLDIFCRVTGFTSDFLSFIDMELRFFHGVNVLFNGSKRIHRGGATGGVWGRGGGSSPSPPPVGEGLPPSGNLKILVGYGWVMILTKPFNVRNRLDRLRQSFFLRNRRCAY